MKYEQYVSLIKGLEPYASANRRSYELRVFGLALLGYAYFLGLILLFLAIPMAVIVALIMAPAAILKVLLWTAKLWWVVVPALAVFFGFLGGAIKALFTKTPEPEERELERMDAPDLFEFIDSTCATLDAKRPQKVYITDEFNAAVVTVPRFGMFGRKVYMRLGLPVMKALTPEQFKGVIAHEIGHISGKHGGFGKWAYQLHEAWGRFIDSQAANEHKFSALYDRFVKWFFPYFQAYSFVLMREHEKEADEYAVAIAGAKPLGEALILLDQRNADLNELFWTRIHDENLERATPPGDIFSRMLGSLASSDPERANETLSKAVKVLTDYNDSHPALADRLKLMGYWKEGDLPPQPGPAASNAAELFLGGSYDRYVGEFEKKWADEIATTWAERHTHFQTSQQRADELEAKAATDELTVEEMIEKAGLIADRKGNREALPLLREIIQKFPQHAEANYLLGGVLLSNDDEAGLDLVKKAMTLDEKWKYAASDVAFQYLRSKGKLDEAKEYAETLEAQSEEIEKAQLERTNVTANDRFLTHSVDAETVAEILRKLQYYHEINALYLVQKEVRYMRELPCNVLFIDIRKPKRFKKNDDMKPQDLVDAIVSRLQDAPISFFAVLDGDFEKIRGSLETMDEALIFRR